MNEFGWIKRRETLNRASIPEDEDEIVRDLKIKEGYEPPLPKPQKDNVDMNEESKAQKEEGSQKEDEEPEEELYIPQAEYTAICNADYLPMICNEFITEFLEKEHGACSLEKGEAIDLVRNFNFWISELNLTCCKITMYN